MSTDVRAIRTYFAKLGLDTEIADIYLALHAYGPQSISQLSRNAHVERTRIYRLIDQLMDSHLVEVEPHNTRGILKAAPVANLHILITQKEQELTSLQDELGLIEQVLARNSLSSPVARIQIYEGPEAVKQIRHNMLAAKSEVLSILFKDLGEEIDTAFARRWITAANGQDLRFRTLLHDKLKQPPQDRRPVTYPKAWEHRYVTSSLFEVTHTTILYDNVIANMQWQNKQLYGVEIFNDDMAASQRALFQLLWQQAPAI